MADYSKYTDRELAASLKEGDQYAYTEIFERYHKLLIKHTFQLLQDRDEASDLVQDVFLTLWQKRTHITFSTSLSSYLYTSVRNRVFDLLSHQKVISKYAEAIGLFMEQGVSITDEMIREKELAAIIEREVAALPPKMQEVFRLSREEELSYKEIAQKMNITEQTAKLQVHNAVKTLRLKIGSFLSAILFI